MLVQVRGMKGLEKAVKPGSYHQLWSAGQSVAFVEDITSVKEIIDRLITEYRQSLGAISARF
ncbi:hypothetical protein MKQ70_35550 [Chitinophaga sedimenti]|uniref:hypothetical protein n=1 Tax=Chitinophaga sedimenti TaxID=2033606 RepID=UPI0020051F68|nr:hypothetical protein [Chitinophaga sedimenti]MCK7559964.1 hypothetical protein [Chitinophaga sedimenti]